MPRIFIEPVNSASTFRCPAPKISWIGQRSKAATGMPAQSRKQMYDVVAEMPGSDFNRRGRRRDADEQMRGINVAAEQNISIGQLR